MLGSVTPQNEFSFLSSLDHQALQLTQEKVCQAVKVSWRYLAISFSLLGVLTAISLSVYLGSAAALVSLALTALFFAYVFLSEKGSSSKNSPQRVIDGIYANLQRTFSSLVIQPNKMPGSEEGGRVEDISLPSKIKYIVISGGGAKGAVLPGAFRLLFKDSPELIENSQHFFGSSVGALFAALVATGITRENLKIIQQSDLSVILGEKLIYKDGKELTHFLRQWIRVNILFRLLQLSEEKKSFFYERHPILAGEIMLQLLKTPLEEACISFEMLAYLHEIDPHVFKLLSVTAMKKEGGQFIFDAQRTPHADLAFACRASSSLPIVFDPVRFVDRGEELTLFDGGLFDNTPVALIEEKKGGLAEGDNSETLVFIFEKLRKRPSLFSSQNLEPSYTASLQSRLLKNEVIPRLAGFTLPAHHTVLWSKLLRKIKKKYQHIVSFQVDLGTLDFHKASKNPKKYSRIGKEAVRSFLAKSAPAT